MLTDCRIMSKMKWWNMQTNYKNSFPLVFAADVDDRQQMLACPHKITYMYAQHALKMIL